MCVQTRVLVTHGLSYLPQVHLILVMVDGQITEIGSYQQLMANEAAFAELLQTYAAVEHTDDSGEIHPALSFFFNHAGAVLHVPQQTWCTHTNVLERHEVSTPVRY